MTNRSLRNALVAATALTFIATPAAAQQVDRIVVFGDSYADDDNFFQLAGINPLTGTLDATPTLYQQGTALGTAGTKCGGTLADIADQVEDAGLRQAAVILVGPALAAHGFAESHLYSCSRERT